MDNSLILLIKRIKRFKTLLHFQLDFFRYKCSGETKKPIPNECIIQENTSEEEAKNSNKDVTTTESQGIGYLSNIFPSAIGTFFTKKTDSEADIIRRAVDDSNAPKKRLPSRVEVMMKTNELVQNILLAHSPASLLSRIRELNQHLMTFPASRSVALLNKQLLPRLLKEVRNKNNAVEIEDEIRKSLALCGYTGPPKHRNVNVLSIDGGGTRGIMGLEVLIELENRTGKKICELFDLIIGASTGALLAVLLGAKELNAREAQQLYEKVSTQLFDKSYADNITNIMLKRTLYNSSKWTKILKDVIGGDMELIQTAGKTTTPKLAIVSCLVNVLQIQSYLFRNYEHPAGKTSHYRGTTKCLIWQALLASTAAPVYFNEVAIGQLLHQDGGILANNPTAIAIHEAKLLWPDEDICLVSVGNGRIVNEVDLTPISISTGWYSQFQKIIDSATDTELVHNSIADMFPPNSYFRFNPYMSQPYKLDTTESTLLYQMQREAQLYVRRNREKFEDAAKILKQKPNFVQVCKQFYRLKLNERGFYPSPK